MLSHSFLSVLSRFLKLAKRNKERGSKQEYIKRTLETIKSYASEHPRAGLHFGKFPKLGINPRSQYKTPLGIYAYPLTSTIYHEFIDFQLPFVADMPYIVLFEFNGNVLDFSTYSHEELEKDIEKLYYLLGEVPPTDHRINSWKDNAWRTPEELAQLEQNPKYILWKTINKAKASAFEPGRAGSQFMNITRLISNNSRQWNVLLRKLGYDVLLDLGKGYIHSNEPTQMVILNPSVINVVDIFDNFMYVMEERESEVSGTRERIAVHPKINIEWFRQKVKEHPILEPVLLKLFRVSDLDQIPPYSSLLEHKSFPALFEKFFAAKYISHQDKEEFIKALITNDHGGLLSSPLNSIREYYQMVSLDVPIWLARYILKNELGYLFSIETSISQKDLMTLAGEMPEVIAASGNWTHLSGKTQDYFLHNPEILKYRLMNDPRLLRVLPERIKILYKEFPETRETIAVSFEINLNKLGSITLEEVNMGTYFYEVEANRGSKAIIETLIHFSNSGKKTDWGSQSLMQKPARDALLQWLRTHSTPEMRTLWNEYNEPKL